MFTALLKNEKQLKTFLEQSNVKHSFVEGYQVLIQYSDKEELFNIGKNYGIYLANNPRLFTIEELEQRGDL